MYTVAIRLFAMNKLLDITEQDINPLAPPSEETGFQTREAVRAVLVNAEGKIALLKVSKSNYHKLPGGGIESGEDMLLALQRELKEETGCQFEVIREIGLIVEHRNAYQLVQSSSCYLVKQHGEAGLPTFTDDEKEKGFEFLWSSDIDDAINRLENDLPTNYEGKFIQVRDLACLREARMWLK